MTEPAARAEPAADAGARWQLQLAGTPQAIASGGRSFGLPWRDAALLAWLAIEGPTPRARLAALLWPDSAAESARNSLRQRLFQLRRQCGAELAGGSTVLALADGVVHDLDGADGVLGDAACEVGGEYALWLGQQRARRHERVHASLRERSEAAERAGDWPDALAQARELLTLEPLSEEAHRRVMRLHYLAGDRAAALLAFDRCEQVLKDEVGTRPSAETLALLATVQRADDAAVPAAAPRVPASVLRPPRLIGRDAQWHAMQQAWASRRVLMVSGEGGMGKSRLVGDFARSQHAVLVTSARPGDERVAFSSLARLLRALPRERLAALPGAVGAELARLLPELGDAAAPRTAADRARLFNAAALALDEPALRPHGIVFDDLHFADDASVELLQFLVASVPVCWALAFRPAELSPAARGWLDGLAGQPEAEPIAVLPLTQPQVAELIDTLDIARLRGAEVAGALWRHTGGNPLFLLETIKAGLAQGLPGAPGAPARLPVAAHLGQLIERRIGRLSREAVALARCAAIAAPDFGIELAAQVLGLRTLELADPWAELEAAQVLHGDGSFAHDLIYEAALASVPAPVARRLHHEVAQFLGAHGGAPARVARHWACAHQWARAAAAFDEAGAAAAQAGLAREQCALLAEAARCMAEAGDEAARFALLLRRALALSLHDSGHEALQALDELNAIARTDAQRLEVLAARLELSANRFETDDILRLGMPALAEARALGRDDLALRFALVCSAAYGDARRTAEGVDVLRPLRPWIDRQPDSELKWTYLEAWSLALDYDNQLRESARGWRECQALARALQRNDLLWRSQSNAAAGLAKAGQLDAAIELSQQARQLAEALGETGRVRRLQMQAPHAHRLRDAARYAQALPLLEECLEGFRAEGSVSDLSLAEQRLAVLFMQLGQPARAVGLLAAPRTECPLGVVMFRQVLRAELARLTAGGDALGLVRGALAMIARDDDIYWRMASLYASAIVPPDEGEAMAASLASWASARERRGLALAGHVRAAGCACRVAAPARALPHVDAALRLARDSRPDSFYIAELWLTAARTFAALQRPADAAQMIDTGRDWILRVAAEHVPPAFRDSFVQRNPVNRELLQLAAQRA